MGIPTISGSDFPFPLNIVMIHVKSTYFSWSNTQKLRKFLDQNSRVPMTCGICGLSASFFEADDLDDIVPFFGALLCQGLWTSPLSAMGETIAFWDGKIIGTSWENPGKLWECMGIYEKFSVNGGLQQKKWRWHGECSAAMLDYWYFGGSWDLISSGTVALMTILHILALKGATQDNWVR